MFIFAADPATGWALVGYIALIIALLGSLVFAGWVLYRVSLWFIVTWYGERFGITSTKDLRGKSR